MLKPSYAELMDVLNQDSESDVTSRYTVVIAAAKRARQIIDGDEPMVETENEEKPVSIAVEEIKEGKIKVVPEGQGTVIEPKKTVKDEIKEELNTANIDFNSDDDDEADIDDDIAIENDIEIEDEVEIETEESTEAEEDTEAVQANDEAE